MDIEPNLHQLLAALRTSGWRHSTRWQPGTRDADGAPNGDELFVHEWTRGTERISAAKNDLDLWHSHILYESDLHGDLNTDITVGVDWTEQHGVGALHRLADAVGVIGGGRSPAPEET